MTIPRVTTTITRSILLCIICVLSSCERSGDDFLNVETGENISIRASKGGSSTTRGAMVTDAIYIPSIGVYGFMEDTTLLDNRKFTYDSDTAAWQIEGSSVSWGDAGSSSLTQLYTFNGYAPFESSAENGIAAEISDDDGELHIYYTVPTACEDQPDLMIARPRKDIYRPVNGTIAFEMMHALAAVEFKVRGTNTQRITAVSISGVYDSGELTWDYVSDSLKWSSLSKTSDNRSYSATIDTTITPNDETPQSVTTKEGYLMMIPQNIAADTVVATVEITDITNNAANNITTKELIIPASEWLAGEIYSYVITLSEDVDETMITQTANSYMLNPNDNFDYYYIPVDTRANLYWGDSDYGCEASNIISAEGNNATTADGYTLNAALLMYDCESFDSTNFEVEVVTTGFSPKELTTAMLAEGINDFTDLACTVALRVKLGSTTSGNIVVAVYKSVDNSNTLLIDGNGLTNGGNTILWSWHLWVTDYNPYAIANENAEKITPNSAAAYYSEGDSSNAVHRYIGDLWNDGEIYADKFIMDRNIGATATGFGGNGGWSQSGTGALYYQYGRKDPFVGSNGYYRDNTGNMTANSDPYFHQNTDYINSTVIKPISFLIGSEYWCSDNIDFGSCQWNDPKVSSDPTADTYGQKSLYDPSPLGWRIPVIGTWDDFSTSTSDVQYSITNGVGLYYPLIDPITNYPMTGTRSYFDGGCGSQWQNGYIWSTSATSSGAGYRFYFSSSKVYTNSSTRTTSGQPVRAIQE